MSESIAKQATRLAHRTLLIAFAGLAVLAAVSVGAIEFFQHAHRSAAQKLVAAEDAASAILLADETLTMSANMAAATGEQRWIDRYEATLPTIDAAIARAMTLASPQAAAQFDAETRAANDRLVAMEREAFAAVRAGRLPRARAILDSEAYARDKDILSGGAERFIESLTGIVRARLEAVERAANALLPMLAILVGLGATVLWRRLSSSLKRSEAAIVDAECVIRDLALNDALTGMPNRRAMRDQLRTAIARADRLRAKLALLIIDLDEFKPVNDRHGHVIGDLVLKEVARRISSVLRQGEARARFGGDEFVVLIEFATEAGVRRVAHSLIATLCQPMHFDGVTVQIGASIGIAMFPTVAIGDDELLRKADAALYRAKEEGRGAVRVYDLSMDVEINEKLQLEAELREGVRTGELVPYFQPLIDLRSNAITGFEILARWRHPTRGLLAPAEFVPLAEASGVINEMTLSVLEAACEAARCLPTDVTLALNVAPQQIQDDWLVERILAVLTKTGFSPRRLTVEVSENALLADLAAARRVVASLKNLGVRVALDDFGAGYSSLCYLSELQFDAIKIDASFVRSLGERPESAKIISAIVGLSKNLGVATVAESVETELQAHFLRTIGCDAAQGYHFFKPMPAAQAALALAPKPDELGPGRAIA